MSTTETFNICHIHPPVIQRKPHKIVLDFGAEVHDDLFWLRDDNRESPEVINYLEKENQHTDEVFSARGVSSLKQSIFEELSSRDEQITTFPPFKLGEYWYYKKVDVSLSDLPFLCRRSSSDESAPETIVLDPESVDGNISFFEISPCHRYVAFGYDMNGSEANYLQIQDISTGRFLLEHPIENVCGGDGDVYFSVRWSHHSDYIFYVTLDDSFQPRYLYRHQLGANPKDDTLVYSELDPEFVVSIHHSSSRAFLYLQSRSQSTSEVWYLRADQPTADFKLVYPRRPFVEYFVEHHGSYFYICTSQHQDQPLINLAIFQVPIEDTLDQDRWRVVLPHREDVVILGMEAFAQHFVVYEMSNCQKHIRVVNLNPSDVNHSNQSCVASAQLLLEQISSKSGAVSLQLCSCAPASGGLPPRARSRSHHIDATPLSPSIPGSVSPEPTCSPELTGRATEEKVEHAKVRPTKVMTRVRSASSSPLPVTSPFARASSPKSLILPPLQLPPTTFARSSSFSPVSSGSITPQILSFGSPRDHACIDFLQNSYMVPFEEDAFAMIPGNLEDNHPNPYRLQSNCEYDSPYLYFTYTSLTTPTSLMEYDFGSHQVRLVHRQNVPGYDPSLYTSKRLFATSHDGLQVPISIVYRTDKFDGSPMPLILYAYGAYGMAQDPKFDFTRLAILDRGFAYAIAHVRGGLEMGRHWYLDGKLNKKMNSVYDFISCAEYLCQEGYTVPDLLAAWGRSAGGLLVGTAINTRPDLFRACIGAVPFVDLIVSMSDPTIPWSAFEYSEWGCSHNPQDYEYMVKYCPMRNMKQTRYPHFFLSAGFHDPRVGYWEVAKYATRLRMHNTDPDRMIIFRCNMEGGHFMSEGREERRREMSEIWAFLIVALGIQA